jgi:choline dehydrogenase-like flavoprotein
MGLATVDEFISQPFDYIIIGGGTAGLTVAARLSEDPSIRVGVIEAGSARLDDANILTPGLSASVLGNSDYDWAFATTPQVSAHKNALNLLQMEEVIQLIDKLVC